MTGNYLGDYIMTKIFNTSCLAVLLAALAFYLVGFLWYGFLFQETYLNAVGMSAEEMEAASNPMMMVWGLLITIVQALGLLWLIDKTGAKGLSGCLMSTFWLFLMIAAPLMAYGCVYNGYSLAGILVDYSHILFGYLAMAAIYARFRRET